MAEQFTITTATVREKANELHTLNERLKKQIEELNTKESVLNRYWDGEANDKFHAEFQKNLNQFNNFYNAIELYAKVLEEIAQKFDEAEKKNLGIIGA